MRRLNKGILGAAIVLSALRISADMTPVQAKESYSYYPMSCGSYEVDILSSNGSFEQKGCYTDLGRAKEEMLRLGDSAVIRHDAAWSANKVIMMSGGVAYSYPFRSGANTAMIYQYYTNVENKKTTYVTAHREMTYNGTFTYDPASGDGWVGVTLNGFEGYINLKNVDLIPMKAISEHIPLVLGGNYAYTGTEEPFKVYPKQAYYRVEQKGKYLDLVYHCFSGWPGSNMEPAEWTFDIGPAAEWMKSGDVYFSDNGTDFYTDRYRKNGAGTYYSYYQFLPLRTKSGISPEVYEQFLRNKNIQGNSKLWGTGSIFTASQEEYGVNALAVFSMACLESGYGTSMYALQRNNLFGWNAFDSDPNQASYFHDIPQAIREHMGINLRGYLDIIDFRYFGSQLGNKGSGLNVKYAADPYWGMKIAAIAYEIDKTSKNFDGSLTDWNSAAVGLISNDEPTDVLRTQNGAVLYNTRYGSTYQKNHMVTVLEESGDWAKIQSTSYLSNGTVLMLNRNTGLLRYDWDSYVGWLPKSKITRTNSTVTVPEEQQPLQDPVNELTSIAWNEAKELTISGRQYQPGLKAGVETVKQTLHGYNVSFEEIITEPLVTSVQNECELTWSGKIPLDQLSDGIYLFKVTTEYTEHGEYNLSYDIPEFAEAPQPYILNGRQYHFEKSGDLFVLKISEVDCGANAAYNAERNACECLSGFENYESGKGCTAVVSPEEPSAETVPMQGVEKISYAEEENAYRIEGIAFVRGLNASESDVIRHELVLVNQTDKTEEILPTETITMEQPLNFADGYIYQKIRYAGTLSLADRKEGAYYLKIRILRDGKSYERLVISTDKAMDMSPLTQGNRTIRLFAHPGSNFRMELSVDHSKIDRSVIKKPTRRPSIYGDTAIRITESGELIVDGFAFIQNIYINEENNPEYHMIFENTATGETVSADAVMKACKMDLAAMRNSKYTVHHSCFDLNADLTQLQDGVYLMYMDVKTDDARDIYPISVYGKTPLPAMEIGSRTYTISRSAVHSQYVLTVEETK